MLAVFASPYLVGIRERSRGCEYLTENEVQPHAWVMQRRIGMDSRTVEAQGGFVYHVSPGVLRWFYSISSRAVPQNLYFSSCHLSTHSNRFPISKQPVGPLEKTLSRKPKSDQSKIIRVPDLNPQHRHGTPRVLTFQALYRTLKKTTQKSMKNKANPKPLQFQVQQVIQKYKANQTHPYPSHPYPHKSPPSLQTKSLLSSGYHNKPKSIISVKGKNEYTHHFNNSSPTETKSSRLPSSAPLICSVSLIYIPFHAPEGHNICVSYVVLTATHVHLCFLRKIRMR